MKRTVVKAAMLTLVTCSALTVPAGLASADVCDVANCPLVQFDPPILEPLNPPVFAPINRPNPVFVTPTKPELWPIIAWVRRQFPNN